MSKQGVRSNNRVALNGLTSGTQTFRFFPGRNLEVPPGHCAVLTCSNGRRIILPAGVHPLTKVIGRQSCLVQMQCVDMRVHTTPIPYTETFCQDGCRGGMAVEVAWQVIDPATIINAADPVGSLARVAWAAVRAEIEANRHDHLFGGENGMKMDADQVAWHITRRMRNNPHLNGLFISKVIVTERRGDEHRITLVRETEAQHRRLTAQMSLTAQQAEWETQRLNLEEFTRVSKARIERLAAEETRRIREVEAEIEYNAGMRLLELQACQLDLRLKELVSQRQFDLVKTLIPEWARVLCEVGKAAQMQELLSVTIGRQRGNGGFDLRTALGESFNHLRRLVSELNRESGTSIFPEFVSTAPLESPEQASQTDTERQRRAA